MVKSVSKARFKTVVQSFFKPSIYIIESNKKQVKLMFFSYEF